MRRFVVQLLVLAVVLMSAVAASGQSTASRSVALARDATPVASPVALSPLLQRSIAALNAGDGKAVAALYTPDGTFEDVAAGAVARGREEIAAYFDDIFARQTGAVLQPVAGHEEDGWAVVEYVFTVTASGGGARQAVRGATVYEIEDGLIRRATDYYAPPVAGQHR